MYAIIKAGGKQYTVKPGDVLRVEKLEAELGAELDLKEVLMVGGDKTYIGENAGKAVVTVVVTNQQRHPKVIVFKKRRRQGYRRMGGHRQPYTELFVKSTRNRRSSIPRRRRLNKPRLRKSASNGNSKRAKPPSVAKPLSRKKLRPRKPLLKRPRRRSALL